VVCNPGLHRWRATQRLMDSAEIVIHKMKGERELVILASLPVAAIRAVKLGSLRSRQLDPAPWLVPTPMLPLENPAPMTDSTIPI